MKCDCLFQTLITTCICGKSDTEQEQEPEKKDSYEIEIPDSPDRITKNKDDWFVQ